MISIYLPNDYEVCINLLSYDWTNAGATGFYFTMPKAPKGALFADSFDTVGLCTYLVDACKNYRNGNGTYGTTCAISFYFDVNKNCFDTSKGWVSNSCS